MRDVDDPLLGRLVWDAEHRTLEGQIQGPAGEIELSIEIVDESSWEGQLQRARTIAVDLVQLLPRAERFLSEQMLAKKNSGWLEEGERPLSVDEFCARIRFSERVDAMILLQVQ